MSNSNNNSGGGGIGFVGVLQIVFIVLKLTHTIHWSWWWVLAPIWISLLVGLIAVLGMVFFVTKSKAKRSIR